MKEVMRVKEVAEYLGVSEQTIYHWSIYAGLPSRKVNNRIRLFNRTQIDDWVSHGFNLMKQ
ncbi:helix-turn-helix domain-containing protein [Listeria innocua]|uniref:helix-turn-helix domain-containing protein n=1 Tax=Listeria innocua TaxID=1642 RepID=UPI001626A4C1|nr:helix-turn-helix domain-containing protein [Listeria innocua]MBC1338051.1 helix-turn-helix domain-containing protein [Listeria innocua]MBC1352710.1 helix-turn-helix domain-containing protein [Listeria innocua]